MHMLVLMHEMPHGSLYMASFLFFHEMSHCIILKIAYFLSMKSIEVPKSINVQVMINVYDAQSRGVPLGQKLCLSWYPLMTISIIFIYLMILSYHFYALMIYSYYFL